MNNAPARTASLLTGKLRKMAAYGVLGLALMVPAQAFASCIKTTTRYYFLGLIEVYSVETITCTHGDN